LRFNKQQQQDAAFAALLVVLTLVAALPLLTKYPNPGGDEPGFIDPAATLATSGRLATSLYRDMLPGMTDHIYWQPPFYFIALAGWFRLVGVGLVQARLFSLGCGIGIVLLVYDLSRNWATPTIALPYC
jgi:4-amino-4-deoxy-L-arabinose transferase-like glycosyltransferase